MNKATVGLSIAVAAESWSISSSYNSGGSIRQLKQWVDWAFAEGCRRLQAPGSQADLPVSLSVIGHADQRRVGEECADLIAHVSADSARRLVAHLALETITMMVLDS